MADLEGIKGTEPVSGASLTSRIVAIDSRHGSAPFNETTARHLVEVTVDALRALPVWAGEDQSRSQVWSELVYDGMRGLELWSHRLGGRAVLAAAMFWSAPVVDWRVEVATSAADGMPPMLQEIPDSVVQAAFSAQHGVDPVAVALLRAAYAAELVAPGRHPLTPVLALNSMGAIIANTPTGPELLKIGKRIPLEWEINLFSAAAPARLRPAETEVHSL